MATEFRRVFRVQGMDSAANPRFQMVPENGLRWVALHDGAGFTVTSVNPARCSVTEIGESELPVDDRATGGSAAAAGDRFFRLHGKTTGAVNITAKKAGRTDVILDAQVKGELVQLVHFFSVSDSVRASTRPLADVGHFLPMLNYIFRRQANIKFTRHGALDPMVFAQDLGNPIALPPTGGFGASGALIAARGSAAADLNVYFVWELQRGVGNGDSTEATTQTIGSAHASGGPGNIMFEDSVTGNNDIVMAHEVGHHLGLSHNTAGDTNLMFPNTPIKGFNLNKAEVNKANVL
jgi:Metallo-peptidase family M12B Reprolysin-like